MKNNKKEKRKRFFFILFFVLFVDWLHLNWKFTNICTYERRNQIKTKKTREVVQKHQQEKSWKKIDFFFKRFQKQSRPSFVVLQIFLSCLEKKNYRKSQVFPQQSNIFQVQSCSLSCFSFFANLLLLLLKIKLSSYKRIIIKIIKKLMMCACACFWTEQTKLRKAGRGNYCSL